MSLLQTLLIALQVANVMLDKWDVRNSWYSRPTMIHLFEWQWSDIASECENWLGKYGFGCVQISPPQECVFGDWWAKYQPVSYKLKNQCGDKAALQNMIDRCNRAGVRTYVDAVINHMASTETTPGKGTAGSYFNPNKLEFPGVPYNSSNFHRNCNQGDRQIHNYDNYDESRRCELGHLTDLDQSVADTQNKIAAYLNSLIDMGVAGFRFDASKHMYPFDLTSILEQLHTLNTTYFPPDSNAFIYHEVIDFNNPTGIRMRDYLNLGNVLNFQYSQYLSDAVYKQTSGMSRNTQHFTYFKNFGSDWAMPSDTDSVVFAVNHDQERGGSKSGGKIVTHNDPFYYKMANSFMLAYPYGFAQVISGFYFVNHNDPTPAYPVKFVSDTTCPYSRNGWSCEQRWRQIRNMAVFRSVATDNPVVNWQSSGLDRIAFSRGEVAFFALNNDASSDWSFTFQTGLNAGEYCDVISGDYTYAANGGSCSGTEIKVNSDGTANIKVPSGVDNNTDPIVAIHREAKKGSNFKRTAIFVKKETNVGDSIFIKGGIDYAKGKGCGGSKPPSKDPCALPLRLITNAPNNFTSYNAWRTNDNYLDWFVHGPEPNQRGGGCQGTPLVWSTNDKSQISYQPLNKWGPHWWMVEAMVDCSSNAGWFELKSVWQFDRHKQEETDITIANCKGDGCEPLPYRSKNHMGKCGFINKFTFNSGNFEILKFP